MAGDSSVLSLHSSHPLQARPKQCQVCKTQTPPLLLLAGQVGPSWQQANAELARTRHTLLNKPDFLLCVCTLSVCLCTCVRVLACALFQMWHCAMRVESLLAAQ